MWRPYDKCLRVFTCQLQQTVKLLKTIDVTYRETNYLFEYKNYMEEHLCVGDQQIMNSVQHNVQHKPTYLPTTARRYSQKQTIIGTRDIIHSTKTLEVIDYSLKGHFTLHMCRLCLIERIYMSNLCSAGFRHIQFCFVRCIYQFLLDYAL